MLLSKPKSCIKVLSILVFLLSIIHYKAISQNTLDSLLLVVPTTEEEFDQYLNEVNDNLYRGTFSDQQEILRLLIDKSLRYSDESGDTIRKVRSLCILGHYYVKVDSNELAIDAFLKASDLIRAQPHDIDLWRTVNKGLANVYTYMGFYRISNEYNINIIKVNDSLGLNVENFAPTINMALNFISMGSIEMAKKYYFKALDIGIPESHPKKDYYNAILNYNFAEFYLQQEIFDSVLSFADKGIKSYKILNDSINVAKCLLFKVRVYIIRNQIDKADDIINHNFNLIKRLSSYEILSKLIKAKKYFLLRQFELAYSTIEECYLQLKQLPSNEVEINLRLFFYHEIFLMFKELGEDKNALEVFEIYSQKLSEKKDQQILREAMENEVLFSTELKERENQIIKEQNKALVYENQLAKQKERSFQLIAILSAIVTIILIALFFVVLKSLNRKRKLRLEKIESAKAKEKVLKKDLELSNSELKSHETMMQITNNHLLQQGIITQKFASWLKSLVPYTNKEGVRKIQMNLSQINSYSHDSNWREFEKNFSSLYPRVVEIMKGVTPRLSASEIRILCFMIMKMENSEISMITMQSVDSLRMAKYRLRRKFDVSTNDELIVKLNSTTGNNILQD